MVFLLSVYDVDLRERTPAFFLVVAAAGFGAAALPRVFTPAFRTEGLRDAEGEGGFVTAAAGFGTSRAASAAGVSAASVCGATTGWPRAVRKELEENSRRAGKPKSMLAAKPRAPWIAAPFRSP